MKAVLRIIDRDRMKEYSLQSRQSPIRAGSFTAFPEKDEWRFESADAVANASGERFTSGLLTLYDAYLLDAKNEEIILILPIRDGEEQILSEAAAYTVGRHGAKTDRATGEVSYINTIELHDRSVSGVHCIFYKPNKKRLYITDIGSTNGTYVNSIRLAPFKPVQWKPGDVCAVGSYSFTTEVRNGEIYPKLMNRDGDVFFHPEGTTNALRLAGEYFTSIPERKLTFAPVTKAYAPAISIGPRNIPQRPEYAVSIESAPNLSAQKPGIGSFGIGVNLPAMAIGFGLQAINYALKKKKYTRAEKERSVLYARYTSKIENELEQFQKEEHAYAERLFPGREDCLKRFESPYRSLWERHFGDEDFLCVRLGIGNQPSSAKISIPASHLSLQEDIFEHVPEQIRDKYAVAHDMPVTANLLKDGVLGVVGAGSDTDELIRDLVLQIAALQDYDNVKLVLLCNRADLPEWGWVRWLPHNYNDTREYRYIITGQEDLRNCFKDELDEIHKRLNPEKGWGYRDSDACRPVYVFIVLNQDLLLDNEIGQALIHAGEDFSVSGIVAGRSLRQIPHSVTSVAEVRKSGGRTIVTYRCGDAEYEATRPEAGLTSEMCDAAARSIAPVRLIGPAAKKKYVLPGNVGFFEGLGLKGKEDIHPGRVWGNTNPEESMAVPIGLDENGDRVIFNIHENGQGPHGLVAGGTGSGKSKMVQAWVGSMAYHFSPEDVNFVLVDFKGESLLTPFRSLPHLACFTSNLDPDVRRKFLAISSELNRRQDLIRQYDCGDLIEYRRLRKLHPEMPNIPFLFLVVDEFASFKTEYPEFTEPLDGLFQKGRSLGFFAILLTQNPSGKVTAQMTANLGFRWCLRVDSESDSKEVIGTPDAAKIHNPGRAYFQSNKDNTYKLLQAFYGGQTYDEEQLRKGADEEVYALTYNGRPVRKPKKAAESSVGLPDELTVLSETLHKYCEEKNFAHALPIWQPELPEALDLQELMKDRIEELNGHGPSAVLGLFDDPKHQRQSLLMHDLWKDGTLAVYGAPQSGKTTFLETYMLSLARRFEPSRVQFYIVEYGGFRLEPFKRLPQTGGYANDSDTACIKRILSYLINELSVRKRAFHKYLVSSCQGYEEAVGQVMPVITLVIDNANSLLAQFGEFQQSILKLVKEGASYGILTVLSVAGTGGMYSIAPHIRKSLGLRLADKSDYAGLIAQVRQDVSKLPAGRGFLSDNNEALQFQTAIVMASQSDAKRYQEVGKWIRERDEGYSGPLPEMIMSMPEEIFYGDVKGGRYLLGLDDVEVKPLSADIERTRSILISYKEYRSCRTLIRSLIRQTLEAGGDIYLYTEKPEEYGDLLDSSRIFRNINELENIMPDISDRLRERQRIRQEESGTAVSPILFIADGMLDITENGSDRLNARLEVFIRLGEGLGYAYVGCDTLEHMNEISLTGSSILAVTAREGYGLITGGRMEDHKLVPAYRIVQDHPGELRWDEAVVCADDDLKRIRIMQGD